MPIYAYKCSECGHQLEAIQKMSDKLMTDCPSCGKPALVKQVTAAGFQLKGSGWYVTDFRDGGKKKESVKTDDKAKTEPASVSADPKGDAKADGKTEGKTESGAAESQGSKAETKTESKSETKPESGSKPAAPAAPAPAPGPKSGGSSGGTSGGTS